MEIMESQKETLEAYFPLWGVFGHSDDIAQESDYFIYAVYRHIVVIPPSAHDGFAGYAIGNPVHLADGESGLPETVFGPVRVDPSADEFAVCVGNGPAQQLF